MAVSDREFQALTATVADHETRLRSCERTDAETRGAAREAAREASKGATRLVATVSICGVLLQAAVGVYLHTSSHSGAPVRTPAATMAAPR